MIRVQFDNKAVCPVCHSPFQYKSAEPIPGPKDTKCPNCRVAACTQCGEPEFTMEHTMGGHKYQRKETP